MYTYKHVMEKVYKIINNKVNKNKWLKIIFTLLSMGSIFYLRNECI